MLLSAIIAMTITTQQVPVERREERAFEKAPTNGWYTHYAGSAKWDPSSVILFKGKVIGIVQSAQSVDVIVKLPNGGTAFVELGPKKYYDAQVLRLQPKDSIEIRGSKVMVNGESVVIGQEVRHKGSRIAFRTEDGRPFWNLK